MKFVITRIEVYEKNGHHKNKLHPRGPKSNMYMSFLNFPFAVHNSFIPLHIICSYLTFCFFNDKLHQLKLPN